MVPAIGLGLSPARSGRPQLLVDTPPSGHCEAILTSVRYADEEVHTAWCAPLLSLLLPVGRRVPAQLMLNLLVSRRIGLLIGAGFSAAAFSGCGTPKLEYRTTNNYGNSTMARSEVAAISLNSSRPGDYTLLPNRINGESVDYGGFGYVNTSRHLLPGNYKIRFHFGAAIAGNTLSYLAPTEEVTIDVQLRAGRTYIFVANIDRANKRFAIDAVDIGGTDVPDACLVLNLPNPPQHCLLYSWYPRPQAT